MTESPGRPAYSAGAGRRFALTLAAAFAVIAALTAWRDRETIAAVTGSLAALLLIAGIAIPARLQPFEVAWMRFALAISRVTTPLFMGIVYFLVLTPSGFIRRTLGRNPLVHSAEGGSYWAARTRREPEARRRQMERQF